MGHAMAFWRSNAGLQVTHPVESLLDKADCTVEALLNEPELIQELKALNSRVIDLCVHANKTHSAAAAGCLCDQWPLALPLLAPLARVVALPVAPRGCSGGAQHSHECAPAPVNQSKSTEKCGEAYQVRRASGRRLARMQPRTPRWPLGAERARVLCRVFLPLPWKGYIASFRAQLRRARARSGRPPSRPVATG